MQTTRDLEKRLDYLPEKKLGLQRKYETIAHDFLDIEAEVDFEAADCNVIDSDYQTLDDIIYEAQKRIEVKPEYTKEEATNVLKIISDTLNDWGFEYQKNILLNTGLKSKKIDCDNYSIIYLAIADTLKLPLKVVKAPGHIFVRWHFDDNEPLNWETTINGEFSDEHYKSLLKIPEESVEKGVYLRSLSREETYSTAHINLAISLHGLKDYEEAIKNYDKALELDLKCPEAYIDKGVALHHLERYEEAIESYDEALKLNPHRSIAYNNKGFALAHLKKYKEAIENYDQALKLNPSFALARNNKRLALDALKEIKE